MDSGNSGSMQSSSGGGDEDSDSRTESISSFLNSSTHFPPNPNSNPMLPGGPPSLSHQQNPNPPTTSFFDPSMLSHNLDSAPFSHSSTPNPLFNPDLVWSRNPRPDPNYTDFGGGAPTQSLLGSSSAQAPLLFPGSSPSVNANAAAARVSGNTNVGVATKNPKKRTRASRRAPTTVLTTDTTNFRQMVQEFTGIPAAPFSASSPFSRRLDLFGGGSAMGSVGIGPLYPIRPAAQKIQMSSSPSFLDSATSNNITTATSTVGTSNNNYQQPSDHVFSKQPQNLLNLQNPLFSFQSLLQTPFPPLANASILGTKSDQGNTSSTNPLDDQQRVNSALAGLASSSTRWRDGGQDEHLGSFDGNNGNSQNVRGYKLNSSDFQPEKGLENVVSSRGDQGNMDTWICPSD